MANWIPLTIGRALLEPMEIAASHLLTVVELLSNLLIIIGKILEIIGILLIGLANALAAAINALIQAIKNFLNDLLSMGFYMFPYAPMPRAVRFSDWMATAAASFDRTGDVHRPEFSEDAYVGALTMCVAWPTFEELFEWWQKLVALWTKGWDFNSKPSFDEDANKALGGECPNPHWRSAALKDIPNVKETLNQWMDALDKFMVFDDIMSVVISFGQMLQRKSAEFKQFAQYTKQVILDLIEAISQTGIWVLPIYGRGGNKLVQSALLNRSGEPADIQSSAEKGAEEALSALRGAASSLGGIKPDTSFTAPQNNLSDWDFVDMMHADLDEMFDRVENDVRMNPQGRLTTLVDKLLMTDEQRATYDEKRDAGYPDEASYFQRASGVSEDSDRPPATIATIKTFESAEDLQGFLDSLTLDSDNYRLTDPDTTDYGDLSGLDVDFIVGGNASAQKALMPTSSGAMSKDIIVGSVFMGGVYTGIQTDLDKIKVAFALAREKLLSGSILIINTVNVTTGDDVFGEKSADLFAKIEAELKDVLWTHMSYIIWVTADPYLQGAIAELAVEIEDRKASSGAVMPGSLGPTDDSPSVVNPVIKGTADSLAGTRSAGEALGDALSIGFGELGSLVTDGEVTGLANATVPTPVVTYDEDGNATVTYEERTVLGPRFAPTEYPDFAGNNNYTIGVILLAGGPSEAPAQALFNLMGIGAVAAEVAAVAGAQVAQEGAAAASVFNNFPENYEYTRAKERAKGNTVNY